MPGSSPFRAQEIRELIHFGFDGIEARGHVQQPHHSCYCIVCPSRPNRNANLITPLPFGFVCHGPTEVKSTAFVVRTRTFE